MCDVYTHVLGIVVYSVQHIMYLCKVVPIYWPPQISLLTVSITTRSNIASYFMYNSALPSSILRTRCSDASYRNCCYIPYSRTLSNRVSLLNDHQQILSHCVQYSYHMHTVCSWILAGVKYHNVSLLWGLYFLWVMLHREASPRRSEMCSCSTWALIK